MIPRIVSGPVAVALIALVAPAVAPAQEASRTAEAILKEIEAARPTAFDQSRREDQAYVNEYLAEMQQVREKRAALSLELLKVAPHNDRLPKLLIERWRDMHGKTEEIDREVEDAVAKTGDKTLKVEAAYVKAIHAFSGPGEAEDRLKAVDAFAALAPEGDERAGGFLCTIAERTPDPTKRLALEERILKDFPKCASRVLGARRLRDGVGKPFELEFADATTGRTVRMADLKGKVVVVDFWATWCGPCVAEMPAMKKLYAEFQDKGVEFIGVSLDNPEEEGRGLTKLKEYVAEHEIPWPQYYQGKGWQSEFSSGWGITGIPQLFVVGPDGKIVSTEGRGKLKKMLPELLSKAADGEKRGD